MWSLVGINEAGGVLITLSSAAAWFCGIPMDASFSLCLRLAESLVEFAKMIVGPFHGSFHLRLDFY